MLGLVLGTLRLPLIVALTGSPLAAAGTNIAISAASAGAGAIRHARERRVDWRVVAWMAPPSVVGAILGALVADDVSERLLYAAIAAVLRLERDRSRAAARARRGRASACGSGRQSPAASASARSAAPSASSSGRCGCRRSSAASGWTSSARPGRTSSSASSSASPASRRTRARSASTGRSSLAGLAGAIPGGWLGARATGTGRRERASARARRRAGGRRRRLRRAGRGLAAAGDARSSRPSCACVAERGSDRERTGALIARPAHAAVGERDRADGREDGAHVAEELDPEAVDVDDDDADVSDPPRSAARTSAPASAWRRRRGRPSC